MDNIFYKKSIVLLWIHWHFIYAFKEIIKGWKNILYFNLNFFSISFLLKTLFSYWHKYQWKYDKSLSLTKYLNVFLSNLISRFMGAIIRLVFIVFGLLVEIFIFTAGIVVLIFWILFPFLSIAGLLIGFNLIYYGG